MEKRNNPVGFEEICNTARREVYATKIIGTVQKDDYEIIKMYAKFCGCPAQKVKQKLIDFACGQVLERAKDNERFQHYLLSLIHI